MALPHSISRTRRSFLGALLAFPAAALAAKSCVPEPVAGDTWSRAKDEYGYRQFIALLEAENRSRRTGVLHGIDEARLMRAMVRARS